MLENAIRRVVIVGGGSAGWMSAAALSRHLDPGICSIRLIESEQIGTVGVGEATLPAIRVFNERLGIDEADFMSRTNSSFKYGIQFENWGRIGDKYVHTFGHYGMPINHVPFHHYWLKIRQMGDAAPFTDYTVPHVAAEMGLFEIRPFNQNSMATNYLFALHLDATLYARYLRAGAEERGVVRSEGKVVDVALNAETGYIESVTLESGEVVEGDLFIDCSGFRALLIEGALQTGFIDWSHWLPCNRAWAAPSTYPEGTDAIPPYTRGRALEAGWQWRTPLQNRTGDGHVFCNEFIGEERAREVFLENIEGEAVFDPRLLKFTTGRRKLIWNRNCVAIGLSGGFLEPLESTSLFLIQAAIMRLIRCFPDRSFDPAQRDEFNRQLHDKYEEARNFLILHYHATDRDDTDFWNYCRTMDIPEELQYRLDLFRSRGHVSCRASELFVEASWLAVLIGQGVIPRDYDPRVDSANPDAVTHKLKEMKNEIRESAAAMPSHADTLAEYCCGDLITFPPENRQRHPD